MVGRITAHLRTSLFRNTYLLVIMRVFGAATGFIFWALAARSADAGEIGRASGVISVATLFAGLAQLGLGYGLVRHLAGSKNPNGLLNLAIVLSGAASLVLALVYLLTMQLWSPELLPLRSTAAGALIFVLLVVSTTVTQLLHWAFLAARQVSYSLWKMSIQSVLAIALLVVLRPHMSGYLATVTAYMLSTVLALAIAFWPFLPLAQPGYRFSWAFDRSWRSSFAQYSITNYIADQLQRAPDTVLPLIVIEYFGPGAGASFFVIWTLGRSMAAWAGSIAEALFAEGAHDRAKATVYIYKSVTLGLALAGGLAIAAIAGAQFILVAFGRAYIEHGVELLVCVALSGIPTVLVSIWISLLRIQDRLRAVSIIMALNVALGMALCVGSLRWGFIGAGVGWLSAQLLTLAGVAWWWRWQRSKSSLLDQPTAAG